MSSPSIGLFTYSTVPRGSVVHTANLAEALRDAGCDVTVYALDKDGRGFFRSLKARLCLVPAVRTPSSTAELVRTRATELANFLERRAERHDLYHAEDCLTASGLLELRSRGCPIELVRTVHHVEAFADPYLEGCQRRSIKDAALCLAVSQSTARDVSGLYGVEPLPVSNGVDVDRFRSVDPGRILAWAKRLEAGAGPLILAVGGVEERKNTRCVLQAFARVVSQHPSARLQILGGATVLDHGAYRAAFERDLSALPAHVRAAVAQIGVVAEADVPALFRLATVLAFPSLHEGFGLAALEALAARLPVVASNRAPLTEFLDASCATLVDPTSAADVASGIVEALHADSSARRDAGERRARSYSWARVAALHLEHYRRLRLLPPT